LIFDSFFKGFIFPDIKSYFVSYAI